MRRLSIVTLVLSLSFLACARPGATGAHVAGPPPLDWNHPFYGAGVPVATFAEAQAKLSFSSHYPSGVGTPGIYLSPVFDAVIFVCPTVSYGAVLGRGIASGCRG
jgi:hypothetical protein